MNHKNNFLAKLSLKAVALAVLFLACLLLFVYIADESVLENEDAFDLQVVKWVAAHNSSALIRFMSVVTFFGSSTFLLGATILLAGYYLLKRRWHYAIAIVLISVSSSGIMFLLKQLFKRHRPLTPAGRPLLNYSFPSGHAVSSFVFFSILAYLLWQTNASKPARIAGVCLAICFSLLIGLSRIVLNYHFATDVIAGFCFSLAWVLLSFWVLRHYIRHGSPAKQV